MRTKIAFLLYLADKASDDGNKMLAHKMAIKADKLIAKLYS